MTNIRAKHKKHIIAVICVVLAVVLISTATVILTESYLESGKGLRETVSIVAESSGSNSVQIEVDNAMISFYFNTVYRNFVEKNISNLDKLGLDTEKSLKKQVCYYKDEDYNEITWHEFFMNKMLDELEDILISACAAKSEGVTINDDDKQQIESNMKSLTMRAEAKDMELNEYIAGRYGKGVNEADVRRCMELSSLSDRYYKDAENSLNYSASDREAFYNSNKNMFDRVDVITYSFNHFGFPKKQMDELAQIKTESDFKDYLINYKRQLDYNLNGEYPPQEQLDATIEECYQTLTFSDDDEVCKWAFANNAKRGDTYMIETDDDIKYYMLLKPRYRNENPTKNIKSIFVKASAYDSHDEAEVAAASIVKEWKKNGKTSEAFSELAKLYSGDFKTGSQGGLLSNVKKADLVSEIADWCFSKRRNEGDYSTIPAADGYYIMYYIGNGIPEWEKDAESQLTEKFNAELKSKLKASCKIEINNEAVNKIKS